MNENVKVYIILLNWNGWEDTIECLESVFKSDYLNYSVVVCDNDSADDSLSKIKNWAKGQLLPRVKNEQMAFLTQPTLAKPIQYIELTKEQAELGQSENEPPLILIQTGANLGFAGGNNVGVRYALAKNDFDYIWLLNNDTVIKTDSLRHMVARMQESPEAGICGSTLLYYYTPDVVQEYGGVTYNISKFRSTQIGGLTQFNENIDRNAVEAQLTYISGASMLVSHEFLDKIGLMEESYFLYFEEIDWATRAKGKYSLVFAPQSLVYHKEGGSIGTDSKSKRSALSIFYLQKNQIKFIKRFYKSSLPFLYLNIIKEVIRSILFLDFFTLKWILIANFYEKPINAKTKKN